MEVWPPLIQTGTSACVSRARGHQNFSPFQAVPVVLAPAGSACVGRDKTVQPTRLSGVSGKDAGDQNGGPEQNSPLPSLT